MIGNQTNLKRVGKESHNSTLKELCTLVGDENVNGVPLEVSIGGCSVAIMISVYNNQVASIATYSADKNDQFYVAEFLEMTPLEKR